MIGFDCLIGHGDRHWTNYGVILEEKNQEESLNYKFAPIYDTASGYLLEMTDEKLRKMIKTGKLNNENWHKPKKKALCKIICKQDIKTNHIELFEYIIDNPDFDKYVKYLVEPIERFNTKLVKYILKNSFYLKDLLPDRQFAIIRILEMRKKILESIIERYKRQKNV